MTGVGTRAHSTVAVSIASVLFALGVAGASLTFQASSVKPLLGVLLICAVVAELLVTTYSGSVKVSAAFVAGVLSIGFLDPGAAFLVATASVVTTWLVERYRWQGFLINLAGVGTPTLAVGLAFDAVDPAPQGFVFVVLMGLAAVLTMILNVGTIQALFATLDGDAVMQRLRALRE